MQIKFTVEEYFRELKLMQQQYGLEEELYPWMYMLLKMAEGRKKEILNEQYMDISIRDVHNWKNHGRKNADQIPEEKIRIENQLSLQQGPPDIAILSVDENPLYFLGCVEVKYIKTALNLEEGNFIINSNNIRYTFNDTEETIKEIFKNTEKLSSSDENKEKIKLPAVFFAKLFKQAIYKDSGVCICPEGYDKNRKMYTYTFTNNSQKKCIENKTIDITIKEIEEIKKSLGDVKFPKTITPVNGKIPVTVERIVENGTFETQILSHLEKFKKVLYTNGLKFYFLTLKENKINVKKIADLTVLYKNYVDYYRTHSSSMPIQADIFLAATTEWDRLIAGLASIDWYQEPKMKIEYEK